MTNLGLNYWTPENPHDNIRTSYMQFARLVAIGASYADGNKLSCGGDLHAA